MPNVHFGQIQYFAKVLKNDFEIQYFFNTAWEPWNNVHQTRSVETLHYLHKSSCIVCVTV